MGFSIDISTGIIVLIIGHVFSAILGLAYKLQNKDDTVIHIFLLSRLFDMMAWILIGLRGNINDMASILVGNSFLIISTSLQIRAFLLLKKDSYPQIARRFHFIFTAASLIIINLVSILLPIENIRISTLSAIVIILWLYPTKVLLLEKKSSILQKVIACIYVIGFIPHIYNLYRGLYLRESMNFMTGSLNNFPFFITLYMTMLVGNMGIILMAKEKTDESIANAATYDDLTGIFNRRTFLAYTRDNIALFTKRQKPISFLIMDLDHFKKINDQHGHFVGDIVLKDFAATIRAQLRQEDIFGRIGGEEFTVLLPGTSGTEAVIIAERLKSSIEKSVVNDIHYTVSIGVVTVIPTETTTADLLYKTGDEALYIAKSKGRNRIEVAKTD